VSSILTCGSLVPAGVIQLVECQLPKLDVAGSSPVARSELSVSETTLLQAATSAASVAVSCWSTIWGPHPGNITASNRLHGPASLSQLCLRVRSCAEDFWALPILIYSADAVTTDMPTIVAFDKDEFSRLHDDQCADLDDCSRQLREIIERAIAHRADKDLVRTHLVELRIKSKESLIAKATRNGWTTSQALFAPDIVGARVVCENLDDVPRFVELLREGLQLHTEQEIDIQSHEGKPASGYRATHINCTLILSGRPRFKVVPCEIQVRTLLQDAWGKLTHRDLYKGSDVPGHLATLGKNMAKLLDSVDDLAQEIRNEISKSTAPPAARPDLSAITTEGIAYIFRSVFGREASQWVVQAMSSRCAELGLSNLDGVELALRDTAFRRKTRANYKKASATDMTTERLLLIAAVAAQKGIPAAVRSAGADGKRERREYENYWRREILSQMPETREEFIALLDEADYLGESELDVYSLADALAALKECAVCGQRIVDPDEFEASVNNYYGVEADDGEIARTLTHSGVEIGGFGSSLTCSYHSYVSGKDD
jgi:ppGpp synthetase/RelA/SpoT-type nucleotidyltranferase